jgi:hypothetical protein
MEASNLMHVDAELLLVMLLINSASTHGRRLAKNILTDDPYNVDVQIDNETNNITAQIMHTYLKAIGLRMVFKKTLVQRIRPAYFVPAIDTNNIAPNKEGMYTPAQIMLEQERALYNNCLVPAEIKPNNIPATFIPGYIVKDWRDYND